MDNLIKLPIPGSVGLTGPFDPEYKVSVFGYNVPHIKAQMLENDQVFLTLDGRFGIECPYDEMDRWVPFLANAMAIAAGYSSHGENSQILNKYKSKNVNIGEL